MNIDLGWADALDRAIGPAPTAPCTVDDLLAAGRRQVRRRRLAAGAGGVALAAALGCVPLALGQHGPATTATPASGGPRSSAQSAPATAIPPAGPPGPDTAMRSGAQIYDIATQQVSIPAGWEETARIVDPFGDGSVAWSMRSTSDPSRYSYTIVALIPKRNGADPTTAAAYWPGIAVGRDVARSPLSLHAWVVTKAPEILRLRARGEATIKASDYRR